MKKVILITVPVLLLLLMPLYHNAYSAEKSSSVVPSGAVGGPTSPGACENYTGEKKIECDIKQIEDWIAKFKNCICDPCPPAEGKKDPGDNCKSCLAQAHLWYATCEWTQPCQEKHDADIAKCHETYTDCPRGDPREKAEEMPPPPPVE